MTYGMWNGIFNTDGTIKQKISGIFHNDLSEALDKINENIDDTFKVYASESERNGNIIDRTLGSSHFWTKSIMGDGLSFVAGAILASGGVGFLFKGLNYLSKASGLTNKIMQGAVKTGSFIDDAGLAARNLANKSILGGNLPEFALNQMQNTGRISKVANTLKGASQAFNGSEKISALGNAVA